MNMHISIPLYFIIKILWKVQKCYFDVGVQLLTTSAIYTVQNESII